MDTFSVRDLRERSGDLVRQAEEGHLSIVAKHGHPLFVAVPLDAHLLAEGVTVALAAKMFAEGAISLGKGAKLAQLPVETFIARLGAMGIPAIDGTADDLESDLAAFA
jgi:prevent-host-death family protein